MRILSLISSALPALGLAACTALSQPPPTPEPFTALHRVRTGPYPLYEAYGDWLTTRARGLPLAQADEVIIAAGRAGRVQDRVSPADGPWLHSGCIFDVQRTSPDPQDATYLWAYGRVVRCDELIEDGPPPPQMGMRPREVRIYDGWLGFFPMRLLEPSAGRPPAPRT